MADLEQHDDYCLAEYKYSFQQDLLQDKVAFITGGASGIGFRIAEIFMRHGCHTVIGSRRKEKLEQVPEELLLPSTSTSKLMPLSLSLSLSLVCS